MPTGIRIMTAAPRSTVSSPHSDEPSSTPPAGDQRAFEILVRQHHRRLLGFAITLCGAEDAAKDIVQEAFVTAWKNLDKFDVTRDFGAWMRGIVRNKARESARARDLVAMDEEMLDVLESQHREWDTLADSGTNPMQALEACLKKLPDLLGQAIDLFYFQRRSGAETATELGADEATVRKRLQRARQQLGHCIEQTNAAQA